MILNDSTVRILRRQSRFSVELALPLLLLVAAFALTPAPASAIAGAVPPAVEWVPAADDTILGSGPVCRASAYPPGFANPPVYIRSSRTPSYFVWLPWGSPYGWYSPFGLSWYSAWDWGWQPYPAYPIAFVNDWHPYPRSLAIYRSWEWYAYWTTWYPPLWGVYPPPYLPPHVYPRSQAHRQDERVAAAPQWDRSRKWVPSPEARRWLAENGDRARNLTVSGRFESGLGEPSGSRLVPGSPPPDSPLVGSAGRGGIKRRSVPWPSPGSGRPKVGGGAPAVPPAAGPRTGSGFGGGSSSPPKVFRPPAYPAPSVQRPPVSVPKPGVERPRPQRD